MTKKALLIGLNEYSGDISWLRGCVNDVVQVKGLLETHYGFSGDNIQTLTDSQATKAGILAGLDWLTTGSQAGDVLVFHYSGHGSQVADNGDDEQDATDEILIPYDHDWNNPLRDDDLKAADADLATLPMSRSVDPPDEVRGAIELLEALRNLLGWRRKNRFKVVKTQENNVLLAACRDNQTSADAYIANDYHGAFTWYLAEALQATGGHLTYRQLAERIGNGGLCAAASVGMPARVVRPASLRTGGVISSLRRNRILHRRGRTDGPKPARLDS